MKYQQRKKGILGWWNAFHISIAGLMTAYQEERAIKEQSLILLILLPTLIWIDRSLIEKLLLLISALLVIVVELLNSAIEAVIDRISLENHPQSKKAKDIASAAVMLTMVIFLFTWGAIIIHPYLPT